MGKGQIYKIHSDFYYVDDGNACHECKIREVLKKQKEKDQLKQKQAQAKQEKKNEESVNYFLADNKTTWFSKLIEKMKGRGK